MDRLKDAILSNFLFIWVDAIFFKKQGLKAACNYLDEINVPYSVYKIDYVFNYGDFLEVKSTFNFLEIFER